MPTGLRHGFRALRHRDYRLFFVGALASNSGNWLQNLAVPFVLFELTGRSLYVGLAGFAQFLPAFLLGPLGGSLADRFDRRLVLLGSQAAMAAAAIALWAVWAAGLRSAGLILALTALTGIFSGLMIPSWQAFVPSLVPKADLASAITLNSTQFNASRAVGPAFAGLLLAVAGPVWAFGLNALSFLAVIVVLLTVRPQHGLPRRSDGLGVAAGFISAVGYIRRRSGIRTSILCVVLVAFFGNPVAQFAVVFTERVYDAGPVVLGVLTSAVGVGAVLVAPLLSSWDAVVPRSAIVRWALPLYGIAITGFGLAPVWPVGLVFLLGAGAGFLAVVATTNTAIQLIVADEMRGRVMSARIMGFTLAFPLGSLAQGVLADAVGPQVTVTAMGLCLLAFALSLSLGSTALDGLDRTDDAPDSTSV